MSLTSKVVCFAIASACLAAVHAQTIVESFESYPDSDAVAAAWTGSANATVSLGGPVSANSTGTNALKVEFNFPSLAFTTETVTGPVLDTPVAIGSAQYVSFRVKGDPAFQTADFRTLYLYAYDADGNFGRWGAAVPVTATWQIFNFLASTMEQPWNSPALPDRSRIVQFAFYQYGSEAAIPAYSATIYVDDVTVRDTPLADPAPPAETIVETFEEYANAGELTAAWKPSANAVVSPSGGVSPGSTGTNAMKIDFHFPSVAFTTETVTGPELGSPVAIGADQYVSFRVKGDPAFAAADFSNLYLYAYDAAGNFGRWGAPVPAVANWKVFNFVASTMEQPWNSPTPPNLAQIVKFAFYQYGSELAIPVYSATIYVDDLEVRNTPATDPAPPQEGVIEAFEYANDEDLTAAWHASANTVLSTADDVSSHAPGTKSLKVEFNFPSTEWATEFLTGQQLTNPVAIGTGQYLTFRIKGDPAFSVADFRNLYLYAYDADGNFGRWGAAVPDTDDWKVFNFSAATIEKPWDSPALPNLGQIVRFAFYQYGSQAALDAYSATIYLDDLQVRNAPLTEFPPAAAPRSLIDDFEGYADAAALTGFYAYQNSPAATVTTASLDSPAPQGNQALKLAIDFTTGQYPWGSVRSAQVAPFSLPTNAVVSFRLKGDPSLADVADAGTAFWLSFYDTAGHPIHYVTAPASVTSGDWTTLSATLADFGDTSTVDLGNLVQWRILVQGWQGAAESVARSGVFYIDDIRVATTPGLQVSGTPPEGMEGAPFTNIVVDEANKIITATIPATGSQGFLTITPEQALKSVTIENGNLVVRW